MFVRVIEVICWLSRVEREFLEIVLNENCRGFVWSSVEKERVI